MYRLFLRKFLKYLLDYAASYHRRINIYTLRKIQNIFPKCWLINIRLNGVTSLEYVSF
jgi:hypothetical protein